jgi:Fe-S-cluster containining protein
MRFIVEDCVRITKEAAVKKNSELSKWLAYKQDLLFFACKHVKDNKCQIYDHRPQICSGFPFYRSEATLLHTDFLLYDENCGFASLKVVSPLSEKKDFVSSAYERHEKKLQESF